MPHSCREFSPPLVLAVVIWGQWRREGRERGEQWRGVGEVTEGREKERRREFRRPEEYPNTKHFIPLHFALF